MDQISIMLVITKNNNFFLFHCDFLFLRFYATSGVNGDCVPKVVYTMLIHYLAQNFTSLCTLLLSLNIKRSYRSINLHINTNLRITFLFVVWFSLLSSVMGFIFALPFQKRKKKNQWKSFSQLNWKNDTTNDSNQQQQQ